MDGIETLKQWVMDSDNKFNMESLFQIDADEIGRASCRERV